jgi:predicted CXXCH cytochrome family protein
MTNEVPNSKFEIRSRSEIRRTKQGSCITRWLTAVFRPSGFEFVWGFVFRISAFFLLLALCAVFIGCATDKKQKWLTFFFDGVPTTGGTNAPPVEYDENGKPLDKLVVAQPNQPAAPKQKFVAHPPYEDKSATNATSLAFGKDERAADAGLLRLPRRFSVKLKVKHQPAENGECSSCHDPHGNSNPKMVLQTGQNLCALCHDPFPKAAKSKHQPVENGECLSCHNPRV